MYYSVVIKTRIHVYKKKDLNSGLESGDETHRVCVCVCVWWRAPAAFWNVSPATHAGGDSAGLITVIALQMAIFITE
jgi:hypothetical protein